MDAPAAEAPAQGITEQSKTAPERGAAVNQGEPVQTVECYLHEVMDTDGTVINKTLENVPIKPALPPMATLGHILRRPWS